MPMFAENVRTLYASLVVAALFISALVLGRDVLIPLAAGACVAFILAPLVSAMASRGLPESVAALLLVSATVLVVLAFSAVGVSQLLTLAEDLGQYQKNLTEKVRALAQALRENGALSRASEAIKSLEQEITREFSGSQDIAGPSEKIVVTSGDTSAALPVGLEGTVYSLAQIGLAVLFALFILMQRHDLRDRIARVAGIDNLSGTTAALGDAANRLSQLFLAQTIINAAYGLLVGTALWALDVPSSFLWGSISFVMRFVPYIGTVITVVPPVLLAAAIDPGWILPLAVLGVIIIPDQLLGQIVEPIVLGPKAGLSSFAMLLAASFWTVVWGPIGLILSAPLSLAIVVLGRHVRALEFLSILLGDEPALSAEEQFYHRLLAGDAFAAYRQIEPLITEDGLPAVADSVMMPALERAAVDYSEGRIARDRAVAIRSTLGEALAFLPEVERERVPEGRLSLFPCAVPSTRRRPISLPWPLAMPVFAPQLPTPQD